MKRWLLIAACLLASCSSCDDDEDREPNSAVVDGGSPDGGTDAGSSSDAGADATVDGGSDGGFDGDSGTDSGRDSGTSTADGGSDGGGIDLGDPDVCGDGSTTGTEACDDGNEVDGDYCSADCSAITGSCGDGVVQTNEGCDDQATVDCATTHDGGDGACVPTNTCSAGYQLDAGGSCVSTNTTGLPTPCSNGSGQTLFRFHYDSGSTSARIDVWDASCSYSFANQACNVREVYPGFGDVSRTSQGFPVCTSTEYIRARFSVAGIPFSTATLYVKARSYATSSSTTIRAWSPLYGDQFSALVDNDFVYDWYAIDWSNNLSPSDDPNLTAIQLYAYQGSNRLAVEAVELCLE